MNLIAEGWAEEWTSRTDHGGGAGHHPTTTNIGRVSRHHCFKDVKIREQ
jgi:hypothetical protein